jgi:hypothetical protein
LLLSVGGWPQVPATERDSYRQMPLATTQ